MIYFPREDDTRDLKIFIKSGLFDYDGRKHKTRYASGLVPGPQASVGRPYMYTISYRYFTFDEYHIYNDEDEEISLADLLVGMFVEEEKMTDTVRDICAKRGLELSYPTTIGCSRALFCGDESYDSKEYTYPGYVIGGSRDS